MKILDTSVAVDHLRGLPAATNLIAELIVAGEPVVASEVVRFELLAGVGDGELEPLEEFLSTLEWVDVDAEVSHTAGQLARRFRRTHMGIDDADYFIAATAVLTGGDLLTTNIRRFPMFDGLVPPY